MLYTQVVRRGFRSGAGGKNGVTFETWVAAEYRNRPLNVLKKQECAKLSAFECCGLDTYKWRGLDPYNSLRREETGCYFLVEGKGP